MKIDVYYVPCSCLLVLIKHVYESMCAGTCVLVGVTGVASAVNVRESSAIHLGFLPYFVASAGINKNILLLELWVTKLLLLD